MDKEVLKLRLLNIDNDGYHLIIKAKINSKPATLVVDTGASRTVFDYNRISKFITKADLTENDRLSTGLGTNNMKSHIALLKKVQLGKLIIEDYLAVFIDLSHVNTSYVNVGLNPIDGVIGSDILKDYRAVLDYEKLELKLKPKKTITKKRRAHVTKRG